MGQQLLKIFEKWMEKYHLQVSIKKSSTTTIIRAGKSILQRTPSFKLNGKTIPKTRTFKYLGLTFTDKLTWMAHILSLQQKLHIINNALNKVTNKHWGAEPHLLKTWYKTVTEKVVTYAAGIWGGHLREEDKTKLLVIQRPFLVRIAKSYRTASTPALQVLTGILPLDLAVKQEFLTANILRLDQPIELPNGQYKPEDVQRKIGTLKLHPAKTVIETIHTDTCNPRKTTYEVFTDGSKTPNGVGTAFCVYKDSIITHQYSQKLQDYNTVFQAEIEAIAQATDWLRKNSIAEANLYSDSLSALMAIRKLKQRNPQVQAIQKPLYEQTTDECQFHMYWIPAHTGIEGNEQADTLAKEATVHTTKNEKLKIPPSFIKNKIKNAMIMEWQERWNTIEKGRYTQKLIPKVSTVTLLSTPWLTSFLLDHGPFPSYLFKHGLATSDMCICGNIGDASHYLTECPLTSKWHLRQITEENSKEWIESIIRSRPLRQKLRSMYLWLVDNSEAIQGPLPWPSELQD